MLLGDDATVACDATPAPCQRRQLGRLGDNARADLVAQGAHGAGRRPQEHDAGAIQQVRQLWILAGMAPAGPNGMNLLVPRHRGDKLAIGIIIVIGAAWC